MAQGKSELSFVARNKILKLTCNYFVIHFAIGDTYLSLFDLWNLLSTYELI